jgi:hypothetical protein
MQADLRRHGLAELPVGGADAEGDVVHPRELRVIGLDLGDLLAALLDGQRLGRDRRQPRDRHGAGGAQPCARHDGRPATPERAERHGTTPYSPRLQCRAIAIKRKPAALRLLPSLRPRVRAAPSAHP